MEHGTSPEAIRKHVKIYISVFAALAFLTVVTVAVSYLQLSVTWGIIVALIIASIKASLVAAFFMHLISERKVIFALLGFTAFIFLLVLILPLYD